MKKSIIGASLLLSSAFYTNLEAMDIAPRGSKDNQAATATGEFHKLKEASIVSTLSDLVDRYVQLVSDFSSVKGVVKSPGSGEGIDLIKITKDYEQLTDVLKSYSDSIDPATKDFIYFFRKNRESFREIFDKINVREMFATDAYGNTRINLGNLAASKKLTGEELELLKEMVRKIMDYNTKTTGKARVVIQTLFAAFSDFIRALETNQFISKIALGTEQNEQIAVDFATLIPEILNARRNIRDELSPQYINNIIKDMRLESEDTDILQQRVQEDSQNLADSMRKLQAASEKLSLLVSSGGEGGLTTATKIMREHKKRDLPEIPRS